MDAEEAMLSAFLDARRRPRYLTLLGSPKKRRKLLGYFYHALAADLDPRFTEQVMGAQHDAEWIYDTLRARGAPEECHVIGNNEFDGQDVSLAAALDSIVGWGYGGVVIACIPGRLGYYEGEYPGPYLLLERP